MEIINGYSEKPIILCHGGAGPMDPSRNWVKDATKDVVNFLKESYLVYQNMSSLEIVVQALKAMEKNEKFNAGFGSALQMDGKPRLTAALMDGKNQSFSGVMSVTDIKHPSELALHLQNKSARVLTSPGFEMLARNLNIPSEDMVSPKRLEQWFKKANIKECSDTVGAVTLDKNKNLSAGTSTGGKGFETPGRISDSATVAGNYSSSFCAISATGIGEEIVDDAVASRIETRVRDGMSLELACKKTFDEAIALNRSYGWIALDKNGHYNISYTTTAMTFAVMDMDGKILDSSL